MDIRKFFEISRDIGRSCRVKQWCKFGDELYIETVRDYVIRASPTAFTFVNKDDPNRTYNTYKIDYTTPAVVFGDLNHMWIGYVENGIYKMRCIKVTFEFALNVVRDM